MQTEAWGSFPRYLAAKRTVDDRALNAHVWQDFARELARLAARPDSPVQILELGAGIGTMVERMLDADLLHNADYTAVDAERENIDLALGRLAGWANHRLRNAGVALYAHHGVPAYDLAIHQSHAAKPSIVHLIPDDAYDCLVEPSRRGGADVVIAHAFLDLVNLPRILDGIKSALKPGGFLYATINFDGATILEPAIDPALDELIERLYHATMDRRMVEQQSSGDSRTGRHLYHRLLDAGYDVLAAGASDWVVGPTRTGYVGDEAYFLHFIVNTIDGALRDDLALDSADFARWIAERHRQIDQNRLVFIAHQLDYLARLAA